MSKAKKTDEGVKALRFLEAPCIHDFTEAMDKKIKEADVTEAMYETANAFLMNVILTGIDDMPMGLFVQAMAIAELQIGDYFDYVFLEVEQDADAE